MTRKPTRAELRAVRRRRYFDERLRSAANGRQRLAIAVEYLQAVLASTDPDVAEDVAGDVVEHLRRAADATQAKEPR
jgi:hypothetical protein